MYKYGHFNEDSTEFIVTCPNTPRDFDNFLFNDAIFSYVTHTGIGYNKYEIDDAETTEMLSVYRDVLYNRDTIMNRLIYIRDNDTGEFWTINWEPIKKKYDYYRCIHGLGYSKIETGVKGIDSSFRIFIPDGKDPVELWTLTFGTNGEKARNISVFTYCEFAFNFCWGFDSYGHLSFMDSYYDKSTNTLIAEKHAFVKPHNYLTGFLTSDVNVDAWDGSKERFIGRYNKLNEPEKVLEGRCSNTPGTNEFIISAVQYDLILNPKESKEINLILGVAESPEGVLPIRDKYIGSFEKHFEVLKDVKAKMIAKNIVNTPDEHFNRLINIWSKQQVFYGARWTRWGMKGYRDIVQNAFGVTSIYPKSCRDVLLKAFKYQYKSGMALRGWGPIDKKPYSDSALWLVYTLTNYLMETGDFDLLDIEIPYFDEGSDTVLGHIETALLYLENNKGIHELNLIKFGDWNDSLTGIGKEGRGESVWLSMAYATALLQMIELFDFLNMPKKSIEYKHRYDAMKKAINENAWDVDQFIGCYSDDYRRIYSSDEQEGKRYINTQSWAIISEISDKERTDKLLKAIDENLLTPYGYLLSYPTYTKFDPVLGRITAMSPGVAENATVYSHGNSFMLWALLKLKMGDKAYDIFKRVAPGYISDKTPMKQEGPAYVFTNCYYGPENKNSPFMMEYSWITGSVGWFYNILTEWMIGVRKGYDGLTIDPVLPSDWKEVSSVKSYREKIFNINILNNASSDKKNIKILLNGKLHQGKFIKLDECLEINNIEITVD